REIVATALSKRFEVDPSGAIIKFEQFCPWKEHLFDLEKELGITEATGNRPLYVLYEDTSRRWRVQAIPVEPDSFASRLPLPESWRGFRDEELSGKSGIADCVFVHHSGFIGGNKTLDGALSMARQSLALSNSEEAQMKRQRVE
ncbi:metal-dependent protein hydrolase, partial [Thamnocephalis sphaerospora]